MVQSVELVLDEGLDEQVRQEWALLRDAGLPSQVRHTGASNAPHVTLAVAGRFEDDVVRALREADHGVGGPLRLGGWLVFGGGRAFVLARAVVMTSALLETQRAVHAAVAAMPDVPDTVVPGRWTPHVTLARRLDAEQLAAALAVLAERPRELVGAIRGVRHWDGEARVVHDLSGTS